jgi:antitoxin component YwqK of YwqJK toxin-antitoxin module
MKLKSILFLYLILKTSNLLIAQTKTLMIWNDSLILIKKQNYIENNDSLSNVILNLQIDKPNQNPTIEKRGNIKFNFLVFIGYDFYIDSPNYKFKYNLVESKLVYLKYPAEGILEYFERRCMPDIDPLPDGTWYLVTTSDFKKFEVLAQKSTKNELLEGIYISFYDNMNCKVFKKYRNGFPDSIVTYYQSGSLLLKGTFLENCNKLKFYVSYYETGEILSIFNCSKSTETSFFKSGNISMIVKVDRFGIPEGECVRFNEEGCLIKKEYFKDGKIIKEELFH